MGGLGVIVEYSATPLGKESSKDNLSCSGLYLGSGYILTHGTVIIDMLKEKLALPLLEELKTNGCVINQPESPLQDILDRTNSEFQVIFNEDMYRSIFPSSQASPVKVVSTSSKPMRLQDLSNPGRVWDKTLQLPLVSSMETPSYFCNPANLSMLYLQPGITKCVETMMPASEGWRLTEDKEGEDSCIDVEAIILSSFVLLKVNTNEGKGNKFVNGIPTEEIIRLVEDCIPLTSAVSKGTNVYIESSPFGSLSPSVFLNSLSSGIISNVCGGSGDVFLTDARCVMGSEGAPVYATSNKRVSVCGIVISPFCWKRGEWLGLSLLATARPILLSLLHYIKKQGTGIREILEKTNSGQEWSAIQPALRQTDSHLSFESLARAIDTAVVGISCGGGWGSGIVVSTSPGVVLTCAHVIQPSLNGKVVVITSDGTRIPGQVIYHTHPSCFEEQVSENYRKPGSSMWDLAVVLTSGSLLRAIPLATQLPSKGSPVIVAGHGIFSPTRFPSPSISKGIVSKIVNVDPSSLSYPVTNKELVNGCSESISLEKGVEILDGVIHDRPVNKTHYEKLSVSPSLAKSNVSEKVNLNCLEQKDLLDGEALLASSETGLVPVILQTTCSVYAGNSGGPVVSYHPQHGIQVVGIMVCNTRDTVNKATFPHINLAVPAPAIEKIVSAFITSQDKKVLNYLGVECPMVSQLWALGLTPQSHL